MAKKKQNIKQSESFSVVDGFLISASWNTNWGKIRYWAKQNGYLLGDIFRIDFSSNANENSRWLTQCFCQGFRCNEWGFALIQLLLPTKTETQDCFGVGFERCKKLNNNLCR